MVSIDVAKTMWVGNFVGIVCARSLHYQFYSWYFHSVPFLLFDDAVRGHPIVK